MPVRLILAQTATSAVSFQILLAAIERERDLDAVALEVVTGADAVASAVASAVARGERVLVGWSFYSTEAARAFGDVLRVREATGSSATHIAGGVHATAEPAHTLAHGFDLAAIGEGERTIVAILRAARDGTDLRAVRGVGWFDGSGQLQSTGSSERVELDDTAAFPTRRLLRLGPIEITRGCVYACSFCQTPFMFKAKFRHRSVESVVAHVRIMRDLEKHDVRFLSPTSLSYGSPDETPRLDRVEALLAAVREAAGPRGRVFYGSFPSEVRPEHVTEEALSILKRYVANDNLIIGAQSGSSRILEAVRRGHGVEVIENAVVLAAEAGFVPNVDFIFGLPGETAEDVEASLRLAERLATRGARIHGHTFMPLPGTPLRNAPAGAVSEATRHRLQVLAAEGALYGQWERQESIAQELVASRGRPVRRKD